MADKDKAGSRFVVDLGEIKLSHLVEKQVEAKIRDVVLEAVAESGFLSSQGGQRNSGSFRIWDEFPGRTLGLWVGPEREPPVFLKRRSETTNDSITARPEREPNDFTLEGENKQIRFSTTSFTGEPLLSYKDGQNDHNFRGHEIDILETGFGKLVTVLIDQVPDSHVVYLTLVLPTIYLPQQGGELSVETIAIVTTHQTPFTGPQGNANGLHVDTYETLALKGTARFIMP